MSQKINSIRPFIGAEDFDLSRSFYKDLGFQESVLFHNMSYFSKQELGFYLQDAYVKDWVDNTMIFLEVENVEEFWNELLSLDLPGKYKGVRLTLYGTNPGEKSAFCTTHRGSFGILESFLKKHHKQLFASPCWPLLALVCHKPNKAVREKKV